MRIYISCDNKNDFFLSAVQEARDKVVSTLTPSSIELVYPPKGWGGETGRVLTNVLQIMEVDLILIDITPEVHTLSGQPPQQVTKYNEGVLIEYGIVICLENPKQGLPWGGKLPKPVYRVFCSNSFPRSNLTPIINIESVAAYGKDADSQEKLVSQLRDIIVRKVEEKLTTL